MEFIPVDDENSDQAIAILSAAFHDAPVINWCCCHPASMTAFFQFTLPVFTRHKLTYLDSQARGCASWLGPNEKPTSPITFTGIRQVFGIAGFTGLYRMLLGANTTERYHPKTPHYYLFAIGVTPDSKGKGIGTRLISHMLQRCDAEGMPAYLENSKQENLTFYTGHGFTVKEQVRFAPSAPPLWLMWREPN